MEGSDRVGGRIKKKEFSGLNVEVRGVVKKTSVKLGGGACLRVCRPKEGGGG